MKDKKKGRVVADISHYWTAQGTVCKSAEKPRGYYVRHSAREGRRLGWMLSIASHTLLLRIVDFDGVVMGVEDGRCEGEFVRGSTCRLRHLLVIYNNKLTFFFYRFNPRWKFARIVRHTGLSEI
jgi:hypothetical protein